ncbi:MAG: histidine phosphatase family protein [Deltaproteobacteria bacterium]|nr:histidine phosphatase family protein [Deltaproteobacteria bacterium]
MKRINRVYLIRHGQINGYEDFPVYGHTDVDLTEIGILQMQQMSERLRLADLEAIYSSDLKRSTTGARIIARYHDVPVYFLLSDIQGHFPEELEKRKADLVNYRIPGDAESIGHFSKRVTDCYERILAGHEGKDIVIVAHGGVNRVILCKALGLDLVHLFNIHQAYGCLNIIDYFSDSVLVRLING